MSKKINLTALFEWNMAHRLPGHKKDKNIHGHRYKLELEVTGSLNKKSGLIADFGDIKKIVEMEILEILDDGLVFYKGDKLLTELVNKDSSLKHLVINYLPSAENLVVWIYDKLKRPTKKLGLRIIRLRLWESEKCSVILNI